MNNDVIIRHHVLPRTRLYVPLEKHCPIPLKFIDVMRKTHTDLEGEDEHKIEDF